MIYLCCVSIVFIDPQGQTLYLDLNSIEFSRACCTPQTLRTVKFIDVLYIK